MNDYSSSSLDTFKSEILEELKNNCIKSKYNDLEDMVCRMQLTYNEIIDICELKYIPSKRRHIPQMQAYMK